MKVSRHVAAIRRQVKRLAASAAERAVQAQSARAVPSFRPLAEAEVGRSSMKRRSRGVHGEIRSRVDHCIRL
jgi:hypothetical protein